MKKVERNELLGLGEYEAVREHFRGRVIVEKQERRVALSPELTMLFENHDTVLLQIQEMLRTERLTKESAIAHEIETYNELVPGKNELSATMFVNIADREARDRRLVELAGLEGRISLDVLGTRVPARNETRGVLPDRTTAVHYVKFPIGADLTARLAQAATGSAAGALALCVDHPALTLRTELPGVMVKRLVEDLVE